MYMYVIYNLFNQLINCSTKHLTEPKNKERVSQARKTTDIIQTTNISKRKEKTLSKVSHHTNSNSSSYLQNTVFKSS